MKTSIKLIIFSSVNRYHDFPFFFTSVFCSILPPGLRTYEPPCVLVLMKHPVWIVLLHLSLYKWFMVGKRSNSKARARDTLSKRRAHDIVLPPHHHSLSPLPPYHHHLPITIIYLPIISPASPPIFPIPLTCYVFLIRWEHGLIEMH